MAETGPTPEGTGTLDRLAGRGLRLWDLPEGAAARLLQVSENATYLVRAPGGLQAVLRLHREGYHRRRAVESELAWMEALACDRVLLPPRPRPGRDGAAIQTTGDDGATGPRLMVLFDFVEGAHPYEATDPAPLFEEVGAIAARLHDHAARWPRPPGFERPTWDTEAIFGPRAIWGDWRAAPHMDAGVREVLEAVEGTVRRRLDAFGRGPERFGLIHADMRPANLLVGAGGTRLIDFDDCGFGWWLYDFAAAVSFMEDDPRLPAMRSAWLRGYRATRALHPEDEAEIDTFVMLRRMALLAWVGSHMEAPEPQALAPRFARVTAELGARYLETMAARGS